MVIQLTHDVESNNLIKITYLDYLPDKYKVSALWLYLNALNDIFKPVLGDDDRAQEALIRDLDTQHCLIATCNQKPVGILGVGNRKGSFLNPTLKTMVGVYGAIQGTLRLCGLALLHHPTKPGEFYVEGVAVSEEMRGQGIGSRLFSQLEKMVLKKGAGTISLEVVDTNPKAKALYERLGFRAIKQKKIWPVNWFIKFNFRSTTFMIKKIR